MTAADMAREFRDNAAAGRFELAVAGRIAFASYRRQAGILTITHVYAPPDLRGTGAAGRLMEGIAVRVRADGERIMPLCSYARAWLESHDAHRDLLA